MATHAVRSRKAAKKFVLEMKSALIQVPKIERFLMKVNQLLHLNEVQFNKLFIATSEAVNNSILHGNRNDPKKKVTVTCEVGPKTVTVRVRDEGAGFDKKSLRNPLLKINLLRENGRGIFLMRTLMDKVRFSRTSRGAEVVMKMRLKNGT